MEIAVARWLVSGEANEYLTSSYDPDSLADLVQLRKFLDPQRAAAVMQQKMLRRKAKKKFGLAAERMFFTSDGLEQATRPEVAAWRARRLATTKVTKVMDLGCGIGADSIGFRNEGLAVRLVELDPVTAIFAEANVGVPVEVADVTQVSIASEQVVFCDPARRTSKGRSWQITDFTPPWGFVQEMLTDRVGCLKLGPGVPYSLLPKQAAVTWISHNTDVVEASVWCGVGTPGERSAVVLRPGMPPREYSASTFTTCQNSPKPRLGYQPQPGDYLLEPDGALIRAGLVDLLANELDAWRIHPQIAYLSTVVRPEKDQAYEVFRIQEVLPYKEKMLRAWVREHDIGVLELKQRGIELDPMILRKRLHLSGSASATFVITPTVDRAIVLVVARESIC